MTKQQKIEHDYLVKTCKLLGIKHSKTYSAIHLRSLIDNYKRDIYSKLNINESELIKEISN